MSVLLLIVKIVVALIAICSAVNYWGPAVLIALCAAAVVFALCWLALPDIYHGLKNGLGRLVG